ncbi:SusC/RagA family TonB-linked outer membrane protein [Arenibacter sp. H213]|uniref:SusC/RagA family TonB-linked outer membrane protein n=1 Tax=Arenibacter antarcticus TaxID=2040469 RepID=A0ABW5VDS4_9FLAO|nr:SusC/RagA family TonB-linked outer membrane protein [Arenibacter sp. H213]
MKLSTLIMFIVFFSIKANTTYAQRTITLDLDNVTVKTVLDHIENSTDYRFVYKIREVDLQRKVNVKVKDQLVTSVIQGVFKKSETKYNVINFQIFLTRKNSTKPVDEKVKSGGDQQLEVMGTVLDESGLPLPGASIIEKGTSNGTQTDFDGNFKITVVNSNAVLVISYIGFAPKEIPYRGQSHLSVTLIESASGLDEVVVTALGISREKKGLGYAIQEIQGDDMNEARETNFVNSLAGKVAGVSISSAGGVGSSSRIVIRGENSLNFGGNDPLYVIDGVPTGNAGTSNSTSADYGNSSAEINPADIESVTVLKGAAAAALYGSRAANGVIVVTTKSGKRNTGLGVSVTTGTTMESLLRFPKFQNEFGQGRDGNYKGSNFGASFSIYPDGIRDSYDESWGPRLNVGTLERQFHSPTLGGMRGGDVSNPNRGEIIPTPWIAYPNNMRDFFQTGTTIFNNVALAGGNDKGTFRLSYTNLDQKGIIPNNNLKRNTLALKSSYKLTEKFNVDATVNYTNTTSTNRPETGYARTSIMYMFNWSVRNMDMNALRDYWQKGYEGKRQFQYNYGENHNNPFFYQYENTKGQDKHRIFGNISLNYEFTDHFSMMLRGGTDFYNDFRPQRWAVSTVGFEKGRYQEIAIFNEERNYDFLLTYKNKIGNDFNFSLSGGGNQLRLKGRNSRIIAPELSEPGLYAFENSASNLVANSGKFEKSLNSLYAFAYLDFKSTYYLDITARNDWSSTLPSANNSYFYPSVSFSALLNNTIKMPDWVTLAKIRLGAAQVGNDTGVATLVDYYEFRRPWDGTLTMVSGGNLSKFNVKPESITTYEIGADIRFFQNRLSLDLTYYDTRSKNHIMGIPLPASTSYGSRVINAGEIQNKGTEIMLNATPIKIKDSFQWDLTLNWSNNEGKVLQLAEGITTITQTAPGEDASIQARIGERMGAIWGPGYQRVESGPMAGEIIIGNGGTAQITTEDIYLGNFNPDWMGSINNIFTYKNISLAGLIDVKWGGEFVSRFYNKGIGAGQLIESAEGRSARPVGQEYKALYYIPGAALVNGEYVQNSTSDDGTFSEGVYGIDVRGFYKGRMDHISEAQLIDATYIKLRELKLGYKFSNDIFNGLFKDVNLSLVGRNLALWTPKSNVHFDPEVAVATTGGGLIPGFENMSLPSTKSIGVNLNMKF